MKQKTEDEAIKILTDRYYAFFKKQKYYSPSPTAFHYIELSDADMKRFNIKNKFLIYLYLESHDRETILRLINNNRSYNKNCYVLDPFYDLQIFSKEKVYKKGKIVNEYSAIIILPTGKYKFSRTEYASSNPILKVFYELKYMKTRYQITCVCKGDYKIEIYPDNNIFPVEYDLQIVPGFDWNEDVINVILLSNNKKAYSFEIEPDKINSAVDRILKKADLYFKK